MCVPCARISIVWPNRIELSVSRAHAEFHIYHRSSDPMLFDLTTSLSSINQPMERRNRDVACVHQPCNENLIVMDDYRLG